MHVDACSSPDKRFLRTSNEIYYSNKKMRLQLR